MAQLLHGRDHGQRRHACVDQWNRREGQRHRHGRSWHHTLSITGYANANYPVSAADTISLSGATLSMDVTWATAYDAEPYIGTVNLDSSAGTAAAVVSPNGSGLRMGYVNGPGTINSTGSIANTWSAELRLVAGSYSATVFTGSGNTLNISGVIDDYPGLAGMPLVKTGPGTLLLTAANTFSGNVTVTAGTLTSATGNIVGNTALGQNNTVSVDAGAALFIGGVNGTANQIGASQLNTIVVNGGMLNFELSNSDGWDGPYMGEFFLDGATVTSNGYSGPRWGYGHSSGVISTVGAPSTWSAPMWLVAGSGESLTFAASANLTVSGTIADYPGLGGLPVYKIGPGTLTLSGSNTYLGTTTISGGVLQANDGVGLPSSSNLDFGGSLATNSYGAVLQSSGTFDRSLGTNPAQVQWTGDGGFAANGGTLMVSMSPGVASFGTTIL